MEEEHHLFEDLLKGLWKQNPVFRSLLGMCPTLAVTTSVINGFAMGLATSFVVICSSTIVSIIRRLIPRQIRIAVYVVIIATFVTVADLYLKARLPEISKALGPYVPLIVVNCIILGRAEAFASKNTVFRSFLDALGMGIGFTCALILLGAIREILGTGGVLGVQILRKGFEPWVIMILPAGAFLTLGILIGIFNTFAKKEGVTSPRCH